jgi:hypothetical protein
MTERVTRVCLMFCGCRRQNLICFTYVLVVCLVCPLLGITLFLLYINDVSASFQNLAVACKLYVDGIELYSCYATNSLYRTFLTLSSIDLSA